MSKNHISKYITELYNTELSRPNRDKPSDDEIFSGLCAKYFIFKPDIELTRKVFDNHNSDGTLDGGIDFWYFEDNEDADDVFHIIQGKNWSKTLPSKAIKTEYDQAKKTIEALIAEEIPGIRAKFRNKIAKIVTRKDIIFKWHYFQAEDLSDKRIEEIKDYIDDDYLAIEINGGNSILKKIEESNDVKEYVDAFTLLIDKGKKLESPGNLRDDTRAIIVNVKASSLKDMMKEYCYENSGLFTQNLREWVKKDAVDTPILETIQNSPEDFWLYNNGIIISCEDYNYDSENVKIDKFSVINGAQTLNILWKSKIKEDFYLVCKIIESKNVAFKTNVALYSNSQKAIKQRDFFANDVIQTKLKEQLYSRKVLINKKDEAIEKDIFCEIKRGIKPSKKDYKITNERIGQLIWSFNLQDPGTARNSPAKMWNNIQQGKDLDSGKRKKSIYQNIFNDAHTHADEVADLIQLDEYVKEYKAYQHDLYIKDQEKEDPNSDLENLDAFLNNGELFLIAYIGNYLHHKNKKRTAFLKDPVDKDVMHDLFTEIAEIMADKAVVKYKNSMSNYTKIPKNYKEAKDLVDRKRTTRKNSQIEAGLQTILLLQK